ncbi:MAG: DHH family phosphoesterase [Treponema sp.]|nr:DHH family phosphoesterase [Treponema sp.]
MKNLDSTEQKSFKRMLELFQEIIYRDDRKSSTPSLAGLESQNSPSVLIQPHDFPDHDAIASAFALFLLLERFGIKTALFYRGEIRSHSIRTMIEKLHIPIEEAGDKLPSGMGHLPCIVIDGNPVNTNAYPLTDNLFAVVDHHPAKKAPDCPFLDVRTDYGSCSSIIASYWAEMRLLPEKDAATALLIGIEVDTDFLSRRVSKADLDAHYRIFFTADWKFAACILKTSLSQKDIPSITLALANSRIDGILFFTVITKDTPQEVLSILADFFIRLREIFVSVIIENEGNTSHISVRSRDQAISAAAIIRSALKGIGNGGGHDHMAGGVLNTGIKIDEEELFTRFKNAVALEQEQQ